jgi:ATP-dependent Clp protease ATP-binding subunit ClpA
MTLHPDLELHISLTINQAMKKQYEIVTIEQLIFELLNEDRVKTLLKTCKVDIDRYRQNLEDFIEANTPSLDKNDPSANPQISVGLQRVLQRAWTQAMSSGKSEVMPTDIIVSIYSETDCHAHFYLEDTEKLSKVKLLQIISHSSISSQLKSHDDNVTIGGGESALGTYCVNLNLFLKKNPHAVVSRPDFQERLVGILARKTKNNPLLLGEHGVGKTYLVYSLAYSILNKKAPSFLKESEIYMLEAGLLIAGAKFKGELEERFLQIIKELEALDKKVILFIDDIHQVLSSSSTQSTGTDISSLLKPSLMRGKISVIATSTFKDLKNTFEKNKTLSRYFQKVELTEPSDDITLQILEEQSKGLSEHHQLEIPKELLAKTVALSKRFIFDRFLPDKAIDILDEACALYKLKDPKAKVLPDSAIEDAVSKITSIPSQNLSKDDKKSLRGLEDQLRLQIYGQDEAIKKVSASIKNARAGLQRENKPIGSFLFAGPTGVGKTELARALAKQLNLKFTKFDMSEYIEKHAVSRLVGAPPGYVGYEEGGLLTDAIAKTPYSLILMDEIEKAHPDLINILLQIMDDAAITDSNGKKVDCRNIVLIMTTNAGAVDMTKAAMGIVRDQMQPFNMDMIKKAFTPEFLNRLDGVIPFKHLPKERLLQVIEKFLLELQGQLKEKAIIFEYSQAVLEQLYNDGFDLAYGARPFYRIIQEKIKTPLIDEILYGKLEDGGTVKVDVKNNKIEFTFT